MQCLGNTYTKDIIHCFLKFKFDWTSCVLSGSSTQGHFATSGDIYGCHSGVDPPCI